MKNTHFTTYRAKQSVYSGLMCTMNFRKHSFGKRIKNEQTNRSLWAYGSLKILVYQKQRQRYSGINGLVTYGVVHKLRNAALLLQSLVWYKMTITIISVHENLIFFHQVLLELIVKASQWIVFLIFFVIGKIQAVKFR